MRERCQPALGGGMPGSPNSACSESVLESASSTETLSESISSSASLISSTRSSGQISASSNITACCSEVIGSSAWRRSPLVLRQPFFEIVDVGAAIHELGIDHQFAVQRNVGVDPFDHGLQQRSPHARECLLA